MKTIQEKVKFVITSIMQWPENDSNALLEQQQQHLPVWSRLRGVWGDLNVGSLTLVSITTHKEADSKDPQKFEKTICNWKILKTLDWQK